MLKKSYKNSKFKIWYDRFELPDVSYSIGDIQDYSQYIIKRHETKTENAPIKNL